MKHRYLEPIALASLVAYAALTLSAQALHLLPAARCACHAPIWDLYGYHASDDARTVGTSGLSLTPSRHVKRQSFAISGGTRATLLHISCPICRWLSQAQSFGHGGQPPATDAFQGERLIATASVLLPFKYSCALARGPPGN